tara:strand:- start:34854 stop:36623 length:1770 start_codon:yes stop_codon:yes gene_type:complete
MEIEVYTKTTNSSQEEFKELLKSEFSKNQGVEEGKVIECTINKVTDNYIYLGSAGLKQEPVLDTREVANLGLLDKIKEGKLKKLKVLLEKLEHPKTGEIIVSAEKAMKLDGWNRVVACHKNEEPVNGSILRRCKGGAEVALSDFNLVAFLPGSMVDESPIKNFDHLIGVPQKFAIVKLDTQRGNVVVSRKHIISSIKSADKKKLIEGYKVGDTVTGTCKQITTFGVFFRLDSGIDVMCHNSQLSYSHISSGDEVVSEGDKREMKIIGIDLDKLQLSTSIRQLEPDPFENIKGKYEVGKTYPVKIIKISDFGFFASLEKNLIALNHSSEISHSKKSVSAKKLFSVGQEVNVAIKEIDLDQRRISLSYKMCLPNPYEAFEKKFKIGDILDTKVVAKNDYSLFVKVEDKDVEDIEIFVHANNLTYQDNSEEELAKYSIGDKLKVKLLDCNIEDQKIRAGVREALGPDPILFFEKYNVNDRISCKVVSAERKIGLKVRPIGSEMDFIIKKSAISANPADARVERWTGGETVDVAISEKDLKKRKIILSIKLLESLEKAEALEKYGTVEGSGRSLPFSNLAEKILKGKKDKKED